MELPANYTYFDYAATTPLCSEAADAMRPYLDCVDGCVSVGANANSLHTAGRRAFSALEDARARIARAVGAKRPDEIIFESGATEADNHAIRGIIDARREREMLKGNSSYVPHFITSPVEHGAVLALVPLLRSYGVEVTMLQPERDGSISVERLEEALKEETALVSLMTANNELGTLNDIPALCACAHAHGVLFHTDATQAVGKVPIDFAAWGVDAASFSAHKICGPKGIGALYLKSGTPVRAFMLGGGQELERRSGTQNVMGAVGFAAACEASVSLLETEVERLTGLRDHLYERLLALPRVRQVASVAKGDTGFLPNIVEVLVEGFESETLILQLDLAGFAVSGGSACSSNSLDPSHVLTAIGIPRDLALGAMRISFGRFTTREDCDALVDAVAQIVGA